jgi:hypothetical protein
VTASAYLVAWLQAFAFTEIVEAPIYRAALRVPWWKALVASAITHPFVWFFFPWLGGAVGFGWYPQAAISEIFAWLVEAAFFVRAARVPPKRALFWSFVANAASVALGLTSRALFGVP